MHVHRLTRRALLKGAAAAGVAAPWVVPSTALGNGEKSAASERVTLGHIGAGGRGRGLLRGFMQCRDAQPVAVADPKQQNREGAATLIKGEAYRDFRELLARDDVDAVVVATPDHWHVPIAVYAARAGKDAYVEKPLGISVEQDLLCRKAFREAKRVFQYGTQQRSMAHCRFGCQLVRSGRIGKVERIEVVAPNGGSGGSTKEIPVPPSFDYDMWLGPAPWAPYTADRCKPPGTYWIYDYSIGYLAGWGAHPLDIMVWGSDADLAGPYTVQGTGVIPTEGLYNTVYDWDMKIQMADVEVTFKPGGDSTRFIGPDGWIEIRRGGIAADPPSLLKSKIGPGDVRLMESRRQDQNFIDAVKSRSDPVSPIEDAVRSDVISHLCDIAVRTGRKITWDPQREEIVDDPEASKMLTRPMRDPWTL
ncbi:MAG TPA: Gfo/Idh/MocA family oxidoreductase [Planctomycetaceae bacterium]|nr:Gfo/Idh/MocA family oxidoreductase [Planctomycetaceae bacterium]HIQ22522.1 Gfo/Idh/MocA family oxidoreductase [Planctomycetota bacterium]